MGSFSKTRKTQNQVNNKIKFIFFFYFLYLFIYLFIYYRHEWYQNQDFVIVEIFNKNTAEKDLKVEMGEQSLSVTINLGEGREYILELGLCDKIIPNESVKRIAVPKVVIKLKKKTMVQWKTLEKSEDSHGAIPWADTSKVD